MQKEGATLTLVTVSATEAEVCGYETAASIYTWQTLPAIFISILNVPHHFTDESGLEETFPQVFRKANFKLHSYNQKNACLRGLASHSISLLRVRSNVGFMTIQKCVITRG